MYRNQAHLTQQDLRYLLVNKDYAHISRCEKGYQNPCVRVLLFYHLLFDTPIEILLERQKKEVLTELQERLPVLLTNLKEKKKIHRCKYRTEYLEKAIIRLTPTPS